MCSQLNLSTRNRCTNAARYHIVYFDPVEKNALDGSDDYCCGKHIDFKRRTLDKRRSCYITTSYDHRHKMDPKEWLHSVPSLNINTFNTLKNAIANDGSFIITESQIINYRYPHIKRWNVVKLLIKEAMLRPQTTLDRLIAVINRQQFQRMPNLGNWVRGHLNPNVNMRNLANNIRVNVDVPPPRPVDPPPAPPVDPPPPPVDPPPRPVDPGPIRYMEDASTVMKEGERRECSVCMTNNGTIQCSEKRHVMCHECFENYAVIESSNVSFDGNLLCCSAKTFGCKATPFSMTMIVRTLSESNANKFMSGVFNARERKNYRDFEKQNLLNAQASSSMTRAQKSAKYIIDDILTLRCPVETCKQAFVDFDGCLILTCSRCKTKICGRCFKNCGKKGHSHITSGECTMDSNRLLFASAEYIANVQRVYKINKLNEYLSTLNPEIKKEALELCGNELRDLKLI
jgi:hypothetical protein